MKKHRLRNLCSLILILGMLISTASAAMPPDNTVQPQYSGISVFATALSITSGGKAECYSYADRSSLSTTIVLTMRLQQSTSENLWKTLYTWSTEGSFPELSGTRYVESAHYYRLYCTATVYNANGLIIGNNVKISPLKYY